MEVSIALPLAITILPFTYILCILIRNHLRNGYFQKNLPKLPILDGQKPLIGHFHIAMGPRNWKFFQDGHKKLGKYFGFYIGNQRSISTIDLDFIKKFAVDEDHHDRIFKAAYAFEEFEADCIFFAETEQWSNIRKAMAPSFSKHKVMSTNVQAEIESVINKFIDSIEWRLDRAKRDKGLNFVVEDADKYFQKYSLALVFTCFYKQYDSVDFFAETGDWQASVFEATSPMLQFFVLPMVFPIINPIMRVVLKALHPVGRLQLKLRSFIKQQLELYKQAKLEVGKGNNFHEANFTMKDGTKFRGNMIDYFIGKLMEKRITEREFYHSSFFLFMAATKTSADALTRLTYQLACHQDVQDKLRESILADGIESTYLTWVVNESLRLFPPAHIGCSRTTTREIETEFGVIPKDTFLFTHVWTIHRWPEYWGKDADEFRPDRWSKSDTFHPLQYMPFGAGRKYCPGKEFAIREMKVLVVELLRRYKFERSEKTRDDLEFQVPFTIITRFDFPTWIKVSRLEEQTTLLAPQGTSPNDL